MENIDTRDAIAIGIILILIGILPLVPFIIF